MIHDRVFNTLEEVRLAVVDFVEGYNDQWLVEKNSFRSAPSSAGLAEWREIATGGSIQTCVQKTGRGTRTSMGSSLKAKVRKHAERVCEAVIGHDAMSQVSLSVFSAGDADCPSHVMATHEYMVCADFTKAPALLPAAQKGFASFLGKHVSAARNLAAALLYWGEGDPLAQATVILESASRPRPASDKPGVAPGTNTIDWLKTDTVLPHWLDHLLFETLHARHRPDWKRFEHNLDLDADDIKRYLGTYFPRSYAEAFCITDSLFANAAYSACWKSRSEAWLLDLGCGTGGNILGILAALAKHCPGLTTVHIHGFDGNTLAMDAAASILDAFAQHTNASITRLLTVARIDDLDHLPMPPHRAYDFITTFKFGGEIISTGAGSSDNFYQRFLSAYSSLLSDSGLVILLDVTTCSKHEAFYPQMLNEQVSQFVRSHTSFATLLPVPCYFHELTCRERCFTQKEFIVSHSAAHNDHSRVTYRVLARKAVADSFHHRSAADAEYVIRTRSGNQRVATCKHTTGRGTKVDGYSPME